MNRSQSHLHAEHVDEWMKENLAGESRILQLKAFEEVVAALQVRTVITLSFLTWNAILDRILRETQQRFPILSACKVTEAGLACEMTPKDLEPTANQEFQASIRYFLIELFSVLENLTAGVLSEPLYQELARFSQSGRPNENEDRGNK